MAMKKAEMEAHDIAYREQIARAHQAESSGMFRAAVDAAVGAWEHIDGMMQYGSRFGGQEFSAFTAIDLVLKYSPLLLDGARLDRLEGLLEEYRRIEKKSSANVTEKLTTARAQLWENHRLWDHLERNPGFPQDQLRKTLGGDQTRWRWVTEAWEKMGLLSRTVEQGSWRLALSTRMGQIVNGKCPSCGHVAEAPKAMFLETMACPECRHEVSFVLLSPVGGDGAGR